MTPSVAVTKCIKAGTGTTTILTHHRYCILFLIVVDPCNVDSRDRSLQDESRLVVKHSQRPPPCPTVVEVSKLIAPAVRVEPDIWAVATTDG